MSLETMTQGIRAQVLRAGGGWVRQGRVVGATALRTGARTLTKTAARLDVLAARLVPEGAAEAVKTVEAATGEGMTGEASVVAPAVVEAAPAVVEAAPAVVEAAPAVVTPAVSAEGGARPDAGARRRARRHGKG